MGQKKALSSLSPRMRGWLFFTGVFAVLSIFPVYVCASVSYTESKGPFKNLTQVVDLDGDGDLDVIIRHTRWESASGSWAGVILWINQGNGRFTQSDQELPGGFSAASGDLDGDRDADLLIFDGYYLRVVINQGGAQAGQMGVFKTNETFRLSNQWRGHADMGGSVVLGDLKNNGALDAFIVGCCYGSGGNPLDDNSLIPSFSWMWINVGMVGYFQTGQTIQVNALDGLPVRGAALGDLDGDGNQDVYVAVGEPTAGTIGSLDDLILLNDGTGGLAAFNQQLGNTDSTSVALGDVNGDGRLDALVGISSGASLWVNQSDQIGSGGPVFVQSEQSFEALQTAWNKLQVGFSAAAGKLFGLYLPYGDIRSKAVFLADMDGDGDPDALIARVWGAEIWWNDGKGVFSRSDVRFEYPENTGLAVADFDGDGDQDIFAGANTEDYLVWWNDGKGAFTANNGAPIH